VRCAAGQGRSARASEKEYSQAIVDLARLCGWWVHRVHDARRSEPGWPDLFMIRRGVAVAAELKVHPRGLTEAQARTLTALGECGIETRVWTLPEDWEDVVATLSPDERAPRVVARLGPVAGTETGGRT
jgi:hypothetical protein